MINIGRNLEIVRQRIVAAAESAGRDAAEVELLAVSKRIDSTRIEAALDAGVTSLGESRVQEAEDKIAELSAAHWHFIGPLQRNKAPLAARIFDTVHSVRSAALVDRLSRAAAGAGRKIDIYVQIEPSAVAPPEAAFAEALEACKRAHDAEGVKLVGLMTMAPYASDPQDSRPYFVALRELAARIAVTAPGLPPLGLSMGMSNDFEVAIEEGATIVRVGTAIFGERPQ